MVLVVGSFHGLHLNNPRGNFDWTFTLYNIKKIVAFYWCRIVLMSECYLEVSSQNGCVLYSHIEEVSSWL